MCISSNCLEIIISKLGVIQFANVLKFIPVGILISFNFLFEILKGVSLNFMSVNSSKSFNLYQRGVKEKIGYGKYIISILDQAYLLICGKKHRVGTIEISKHLRDVKVEASTCKVKTDNFIFPIYL